MMDGDRTPRPRRTAPKEVRRQQLIDATIATIAELGVSRATMTEITRRAGLSLGIVNLHFDSKDNLLKATLTHLADELRERWSAVCADETLAPAQRLWGVIGAAFDADIATRNKVRCWFAFFGEARYRGFYREMVAAYDDERAEVVEALLGELAAHAARPAVDPHALTQSLECLADGLWLGMMLYPRWVDPDAARQRLWDLLSSHFPEFFPPGAAAAMASVR